MIGPSADLAATASFCSVLSGYLIVLIDIGIQVGRYNVAVTRERLAVATVIIRDWNLDRALFRFRREC